MKYASLLLSFALTVSTAALSFAAEPTSFQVKVSGHGQPMILIPGLATPGAVWDATVAHFRDRYECHVVSIAGFGGTPARAAAETPLLAAVREELATYIGEHQLAQPVIVGHSLGGFVALDLAAKHPALPGKLVIVDSLPFFVGVMQPGATLEDAKRIASTVADIHAKMDSAAFARMIRGGPNGSTMAAGAADLDKIIAWGLASDPTTVAQATSEMYTSDLRADLAAIKVPVLTLAAWVGYAPYSNHEYINQSYHEQYAKLANFKLSITDTARHFIMLDAPDWTFAEIENFLGSRSPGVASAR